MTTFEIQQNKEAILNILKARWFYVSMIMLQGLLVKIFLPNVPLPKNWIILIVVAVVFSVNFLFWLYVRRSAEKINPLILKIIISSQVPLEQFGLAAILFFSGTSNKMLIMMFIIPIMVGSTIYKVKGIILSTLTTIIIYDLLVLLEYLDFMPPVLQVIKQDDQQQYLPLRGNLLFAKSQVTFFNLYIIGAAFYAAFLSNMLKRREQRALDQKNEVSEKTVLLIKKTDELETAKFKLENEKNKVEAVIKSLTDGLIVQDDKGKVILINQTAGKLLGIKNNDNLLNKKLGQSNIPEIYNLSRLLDSHGGLVERAELAIGGKFSRVLEVSTADVLEADHKFIGKIIILHDITREKAIDKIKSEFVSITAHQLRTPLTAIKWVFKTILDKDCGQISREQEEILNKGFKSNERVILLINDLLEVARIEEGKFNYKFADVPFNDLVDKAMENFTSLVKEKGIIFKIRRPSTLNPMIKADREKMEMAIFNLVENALLYTPNDGEVTILISVNDKTKELVFSITDTGIGISQENYDRIFTKFFRSESAVKIQTEGSGLSLFIVKNIVEGHGGKIWFESEVGKGTTFYINLPLAGKKQP